MIQESARLFARPIALGDAAADCARPARPAAPPLPPDLAALERAGLPPGPLHAALAEARRAGVEPFDALLASNAFSEDDLVRALARSIGVDVVGAQDRTAGPIDADAFALAMANGHLAGVDACGEPRFVVATRGTATRRLATSRRGQTRTHAIALAGPRAFMDLAVARACERLAERAAEGPAAKTPELTVAHAMPRVGRRGRIGLFVLLTAFVAAAIWAPGAGDLLLLFGGLLFAASNGFRLLVAFTPPRDRLRAETPDADLPVYTVLTALYGEAAVVPGLLDALERLDYPRAKLDLKILIEDGDEETIRALAERPPRAGIEIMTLPPGGPRTKPRALNAGLLAARGAYVTVYDAEDRPDPAQLRLAVEAFRRSGPDLACVQAKLAIDNLRDGWLVRHFAIEYAALFDVVLPALAALRLPIPLGGTSNHFRTATLRALGGWDAGNVTEDADLGLRLARSGFRTATIHSTTWEEAPIAPKAWLKQRTRWMKGYMVTAIVHGRRPAGLLRRLGWLRFVAAQLAIAGVVLSALAYPVALAALLLTGFTGVLLSPASGLIDGLLAGFHVASLILGFACALACGWMGIDRRLPQSVAADLFTLPLYWLLVGAAAWRALAQIVMDDASHWEKTAHGVSRRRETPPQT
ncbi:MAG: hypothetical protein DI534_11385 [Leifsonia xyli]|uniref:Glycosyltransferase 2-like domain-containing protein n=1 Tax=Ancylobacter novellus TaxID=921 RepID=A0A2W5KNW8_ANCNO|nr:MAG: hypothetical protein DI565_07240 [Ancylobacter novellus]PZQ88744.1 MAG: hypothetical protein DI534_11385 [Leifsonia xyli]